MAAAASSLRVTFVRRASDIDDAAWRECFREPLEDRFWYETLEASALEDQFQFYHGVLTEAGRTVGIAPCFLYDVPITLVAPPAVAWVLRQLSRIFPRVGFQRTFFVGSPCADEGTIGLAAGAGLADVLPALRAAVLDKARELRAPMVVFKDFPAADLAAVAGPGGFCRTLSYPGTSLSLPAPDKEAYYRSLTHTHRHNLRKKLRRSCAILDLETQVVTHPSDAALQEIWGLFSQTYERGRTKFERLGPEFFLAIRGRPETRFILLREKGSGALVAFMLVFVLGRRMINKFIGLDYSRPPEASLYFRLFDSALDFAYAQGLQELQSGQTGYRAKLDLGHRLVPLFNVFHHENPLVHFVFRLVGERVTWRSLDPDLDKWLKAHPENDRGFHGEA